MNGGITILAACSPPEKRPGTYLESLGFAILIMYDVSSTRFPYGL